MIEIGNTLVSLDLAERFFCCDLDQCLGQCCIEGDAGAPITTAEQRELERVLPMVEQRLTPQARRVIGEQGVSYIDEEGDLVTSIVGGRDCVFTCHAPGGKCLCAIDSAFRQGLTGSFRKPISCYLYPLRLVHRRQLPPMENMPERRSQRPAPRHTLVPVHERPPNRTFRQGMVRRAGPGMRSHNREQNRITTL